MFKKINLKIQSFIVNNSISKISRDVKQHNLTYLSEAKIHNIENCIKDIKRKNIPGIFVEMGIALGGSALIICKLMGHERKFHGYDVFEMIPSPSSIKDDQKSRDRFKVIKSGKSKGIGGDLYYGYEDKLYEKVINNFNNFNIAVDNKRIHFHRGLFEDTLKFSPNTKIAFAHIDCDWYEPVNLCLNRVYPNLSKHGYIVIDDYKDYGGCRIATDEFLLMHSEIAIIKSNSNLILKKMS